LPDDADRKYQDCVGMKSGIGIVWGEVGLYS
jgi:hypothetical protein